MPKERQSPPPATEVIVRAATADDRAFVIAAATRLADFGPPAWRMPIEIVAREQQVLRDFFDQSAPGKAVFIAEQRNHPQLGYIYLETHEDYFTGSPVAHVSTLVVTEHAEGRGIAKALIEAAEEWARGRGYQGLTLNVFAGHRRAREIYKHLGFAEETVHYVKNFEI